MFKKKINQTTVETQNDKAFAEITGHGRFGYLVKVNNPVFHDYYYGSAWVYQRTFWFGKERAERYANRKVIRVQREIDHSKYSKRIMVTD